MGPDWQDFIALSHVRGLKFRGTGEGEKEGEEDDAMPPEFKHVPPPSVSCSFTDTKAE